MALPNFLKFLELSSDNSLKLLNSENDKTKRFLSFIGVLNLNKKNDAGQTLLHQAIANNQTEVAKYLVDKGADLNLPDTKGNTPLHIATQNNQTEVIKYLVDKGARLNLQNNEGKIPLDMADQKNNPNLKEKLFEEINLNEPNLPKEIDLDAPNDNKRQSSVKSEKSTRSNSQNTGTEEKTQDKKISSSSNWQVITPTSQTNSQATAVKASSYRTVVAENTTTPIIPTLIQPKKPETPYQNPKAAEIGTSIRKEVPNNTLASATAVANELESKQLPDNHSPKQPATRGMIKVPLKKVTHRSPGQGNSR